MNKETEILLLRALAKNDIDQVLNIIDQVCTEHVRARHYFREKMKWIRDTLQEENGKDVVFKKYFDVLYRKEWD